VRSWTTTHLALAETCPPAVSANCVSLYHLLVDNVKSIDQEVADLKRFWFVCDDPWRDVRVTAAVRNLAPPNVIQCYKEK
jgi:hypothetical protein